MGLRDERTRRTRELIADSALELISEKGYDETTYDDVADKAGVSRSTVFRYFPEKEEFLFARDVDHLRALQTLLRASQAKADDTVALHRVMIDFARHMERDETLAARARLVVLVPRLLARSLAIRNAWEELIARDLACGGRPAMEHRVMAATVVGAMYAAVGEWQAKGGSLPALVRKALTYTKTASV